MHIFWAIVAILIIMGCIFSIKPYISFIQNVCKTKNYSKILEDEGINKLVIASMGIIFLYVVIYLIYELFIFLIN